MICLKMATIKSNKLEYYRQHSGPSNLTIIWEWCDVSGGGIPAHRSRCAILHAAKPDRKKKHVSYRIYAATDYKVPWVRQDGAGVW